MKIVSQLIIFIILLAVGWITYEKHDAFHELVNDIARYNGFMADELSETARGDSIPAKISEPAGMQPAEKQLANTDQPDGTRTEIQGLQQQDIETDFQSGQFEPTITGTRSEESPIAVIADTEDSPESGNNLVPKDTAEIREPPKTPGKPERSEYPTEISSNILQRKENALAGLAAARQAWHSGRHKEAVRQYTYLLQEYRNHPDFAGELGNIHFSRGETELAVDAYSEAVVRLLRNGDRIRAGKTLHIIYKLDQEQADILHKYFIPSR